MAELMSVEVCYAMSDKQEVVRLKLPAGATLQQGLEASGLLGKHPEIDVKKNKFGIWNKLSKLDAVLRDKDRIEIYRPLIADPKEVRKQRAAEEPVLAPMTWPVGTGADPLQRTAPGSGQRLGPLALQGEQPGQVGVGRPHSGRSADRQPAAAQHGQLIGQFAGQLAQAMHADIDHRPGGIPGEIAALPEDCGSTGGMTLKDRKSVV